MPIKGFDVLGGVRTEGGVKLVAAQLSAEPGDIERNLRAHVAAVRAAASQRADLILFPELSLTGYEPKRAEELATAPDDGRLEVFQQLADEHAIVICVGAPTRSAGGIRIGMVVFQSNSARLTYEKQRLHADEKPFFVAGARQVLLPVRRHTLAPAICYESLHWDHADAAAAGGADIYLVSVAKSQRNVAKAYEHYAAVARKHSFIVLMANSTGPAEDFVCAGQSAIWSQSGELVARLDETATGLVVFDTATRAAAVIPYEPFQ